MKRVFVFCLWLVFTCLLAACGNNATPIPTAAATPILSQPAALPAQTASPASTPPAIQRRGYHAMTYDTESKKVIVYGGQLGNYRQASNLNQDTWAFDPLEKDWKKMSPVAKPGGSAGGDMTYNSKADRAILVIGADPATPNFFDFQITQTWAYDYNTDTWTRLADMPFKGSIGPRIVYDSESDKIILFGGFTLLGESKVFNETWAYDYNTNAWTQMQPQLNPEPRNYHGMAYDIKTDRAIVWGGAGLQGMLESLWAYDYNTNTWEEIKYKNGPSGRDYNGFVYDVKADRFILYGGFSVGSNETWVYDANSNTWTQMKPALNPGRLSRHGMVYNPDINQVILYGGQVGSAQFAYTDKTWFYDLDSNIWTNAFP